MKKIAVALLAVALLLCVCLPVSARETACVLTIDNVDYIFDDALTYEEQLQLIDAIRHGDDGVATCGLMCTLFGHKYEEKSVTATTHGVNSRQPTCLEEYFLVAMCSRCEEYTVERTGYCYIHCECGQ